MEHFDWLYGAVFPYINFLIFAGALAYFLKDPLKTMAANRRVAFEASLAAAQSARIAAESQNQELRSRLSGLEKEFRDLENAMLAQAENEAEKMKKQAILSAEHMKQEAQRIAEFEVENARKKLRAQMVSDLTSMVENKIKFELKADQKQKFLESQISSVDDLNQRGGQSL